MSKKKIRPLSDRVVVEPRELETKTAGGIVIPDTADKDKPIQGTVIAIGNGKYVDGKMQPLQVKVGDKVLFGKYPAPTSNSKTKNILSCVKKTSWVLLKNKPDTF